MLRRTRLPIALMLLVALVVAGLMPAAGSWSCPDGTACVYTAGRGFHCAGDECKMACCAAAKKPSRGCGRCEHGALPGVRTNGARPLGVSEAAHCRYRETKQLEPPSMAAAPALDLQWHVVALLVPVTELPVVERLSQRLAPIRGSPPPSHTPPLASPRAPPGLDCA
jgi:hypothetical protein